MPEIPARIRLRAIAGIPLDLWPAPKRGGRADAPWRQRHKQWLVERGGDPVATDPARAAADPLLAFAPADVARPSLIASPAPVEVERVRRAGDAFRCSALSLVVTAADCITRQRQAAAAYEVHGKGGPCSSCSVGEAIEARLHRRRLPVVGRAA